MKAYHAVFALGKHRFAPRLPAEERCLWEALRIRLLPDGCKGVDRIKTPLSKFFYRKVFTSSTHLHPEDACRILAEREDDRSGNLLVFTREALAA